MILLMLTFVGDSVFKFFKYPTPALVSALCENKIQAFLRKLVGLLLGLLDLDCN